MKAKVRWLALKFLPARVFAGNNLFFVSNVPDSQSDFGSHAEHADLFSRFTDGNKGGAVDAARLWAFILNIKEVMGDAVPGDFAELGVHRGNTSAVLWHYASKFGRKAFLFDTFEGFDSRDLKGVDATRAIEFGDTNLDLAKRVVGAEDSPDCVFVKGFFPESVQPAHAQRTYAVVSIDCDLYAPALSALDFFYERMPTGGIFFIHDYSSGWWPGITSAVREFCERTGEKIVLLPDKSGSGIIRKSSRSSNE